MICTEREAAEKVCTHLPSHTYRAYNYLSEYVTQSGRNEYRLNGVTEGTTNMKCLGTRCMHWEWNFQPDDVSSEAQREREKHGGNGRGRCGRDHAKVIVV